MLRTRFNPDAESASAQLQKIESQRVPSAWLEHETQALTPAEDAAFVVLLGATDLVGFRLRIAQSALRADALPSFFSHVALALRRANTLELHHVPLTTAKPGSVPKRNGIEPLPVTAHARAAPSQLTGDPPTEPIRRAGDQNDLFFDRLHTSLLPHLGRADNDGEQRLRGRGDLSLR